MSLQLAAQHLASRGRGPDSMLVHMAPREVAGLQALARAHGGALTVNPQTGLPEAGFLSSILPMIAGVALGPAGIGLTAMQAALATGAVGTLATGSLRKGLMAGLGAYGGAGIGGAIGDIGANAIGAGVAPAAAAGAAPVAQAMPQALGGADLYADVASIPAAAGAPAQYASFAPTATNYGAFGEAPVVAAPAPVVQPPVTPQPVQGINPAAASADYRNAMDIASDVAAPKEAALREAGPTGRFSRGLQEIGKDPSQLFKKDNLKYGLAALAPMMFQDQKAAVYQGSGPNPYRYAYDPGRVANPQRAGGIGEYNYFNPVYTRMADGGPVQAMSDRNDQEMFMTNGAQRFADGGDVSVPKYVFDPLTNTLKDVTTIQPVQTVTQMPGVSKRQTYYDPYNLSGEEPIPGNIGFAYDQTTGLPNAVTTAMVPIANALNITSPQQGAIMGIPNPLAMMGFAALGNAAQQAQNTNISQIAESSGNQVGPQQGGMSVQEGMLSGLDAGPTVGFDTSGFGSYGENVAPNDGVEVGGPIASGDATGVGLGGLGGLGDVSIGDAVAGISAADVAAAAAAAASASGDSASADGDGEKRGGLLRKRVGGLAAAYAYGGMSNLGSYSDGGRLLRGPGDGVSDSIPATIADKRPARLADGEFVVPARIVSELGNGSTEAGARKLYAMMDRIQRARNKTVGKGKVAVNSRAEKMLPA